MPLSPDTAASGATLFGDLPVFPVALPNDELKLLAHLPMWETVQEIEWEDEPAARRLEKRGLIRIHRWKDDPVASGPTMYAGKLAAAGLSLAAAQDPALAGKGGAS